MLPDEYLKASYRFSEWQQRADDDEATIRLILQEDGPSNTACFHAQQMAEKYLKGFLVFYKRRLEKTHLLDELLNECEQITPVFKDLAQATELLSQFYIEARYPGDNFTQFNATDAKQAFKAAMQIKEFVLEKIQSEKKPNRAISNKKLRETLS